MTFTGKKVETLVKQMVSGRTVSSGAALANPESLEFFRRFAEEQDQTTTRSKI